MSIVVFKLGGSLLDSPGLADRLVAAFALRPHSQKLIIVGGGPTADVVRAWDQRHQLGEETAHWLALKSLSLNAALIEALLPETVVAATREAAEQAWKEQKVVILSAFEFIQCEEPRQSLSMPHHWDCTSDSIAAWIARSWPADELVLLKSAPWPDQTTFESAASSGLLDRTFARMVSSRHSDLPEEAASANQPATKEGIPLISGASSELRIGWCNLRGSAPTIATIRSS